MKPHKQAEDIGGLGGPSRRPNVENSLFFSVCNVKVHLFFCCIIDVHHMFIFIPECNCFISLIVKYHIKIYALSSLRFWTPPVFDFYLCVLYRALHVSLRPFPDLVARSASRCELGSLGKSPSVSLCLLVWLHHNNHSRGRVLVFTVDGSSQTGPVCRD